MKEEKNKNSALHKAKKSLKDSDLTVEEIIQLFEYFQSYRKTIEPKINLVRKFYDGEFWNTVRSKLPKYQITPDTNYIEYATSNIINSVYAANYVAQVLAKTEEEKETVRMLNSLLQDTFDKGGLKIMYPKLGKNALLANYGGIQVGWSEGIINAENEYKSTKSRPEFKLIPYKELYLDPSIVNYKEGRAMFIARRQSVFDVLSESLYKEAMQELIDRTKQGDKEFNLNDMSGTSENYKAEINIYSRTVVVIECYIRTDEGIDKVVLINKKHVIYHQRNIQPSTFPVRVLYNESPESDPYGIPFFTKIIQNYVTLNLLDSIEATSSFLTQNRPKVVNAQSGINYREFTKHGNEPHIAFPVKGNPRDVVAYIDQQPLPRMEMLKMRLEASIMLVTGVDPRYTGRDTGSVQTTGGMDMQQQRIISMSDNTRITNLEVFVEDLTKLVLDMYLELSSDSYEVTAKNRITGAPTGDAPKEINFKELREAKKNQNYELVMHAGPHLPKNIMQIAENADELMNYQGQYQFNPPIITPEEWLMWKNIPQKDLILQRMRLNAQQNDTEELVADLMTFADLIEKGVTPEEAVQIIVEEKQFKRDNPDLPANQRQQGELNTPIL